jgi:hypothetical protein
LWVASGSTVTATACDAINDINWHHYAVVKYGSVLTLYVDGVGGATTGAPSTALVDGITGPSIGGAGGPSVNSFNGWLDEIRFSKGIARYTANFTPPNSPFYPTLGEYVYFADGYSVY